MLEVKYWKKKTHNYQPCTMVFVPFHLLHFDFSPKLWTRSLTENLHFDLHWTPLLTISVFSSKFFPLRSNLLCLPPMVTVSLESCDSYKDFLILTIFSFITFPSHSGFEISWTFFISSIYLSPITADTITMNDWVQLAF